MADAQLSVELTAKIDALRDGFNKAIKESGKWDKQTQAALANVDKGFAKLATDVEKSSNSVSRSLAKAAAQSATSGKAIAKGSDQAAFALTNLGRVAQDAPFGFVGIQNNLNPLLESFQRLRVESGSNSAALKALGQQLIGPAGLGIALSVVSAGILIYQQYQQKANKATENAKKVTDDYVKSLDAVTGAQLKGSQNAQKELTDLRILYNAYTNANEPLKTRQNAYKQLQELYPAYFGNLKFEETAGIKTANAYNLLTQEILASARARAAADKISANEGRKLEDEQKLIDLSRERIKLLRQQSDLQDQVDAGAGAAERGDSSGANEAIKLLRVNRQVEDNLKSINNLVTDRNILDEQNGRLVGYVNSQLEKGAKLSGGFGSSIKKAKEEIAKDLRSIASSVVTSPRIDLQQPTLVSPDLNLKGVTTGLSEYIKLMQEAYRANEQFSQSVTNLATSTLSSGLSDAFSSIGQSLAEGTNAIDAFGSALLSAFAGFLSQLGQMFIKEGIAQIGYGIAKNLIVPGSGANNITGGIGMIAAGGVISAIGGAARGAGSKGKSNYNNVPQVRGFATGGYNLPGGLALVGERGPELINLPTGSSVDNNTKTNRILSASPRENVVINGNLELGLEKLYLRLEQTGKRINRKS